MVELYDMLSPWYGTWSYAAAFARTGAEWKIVLSLFWPQKIDDQPTKRLCWDYGEMKLLKGSMSREEAQGVFCRIADADELIIPDHAAVRAAVSPDLSTCLQRCGRHLAPFPLGFSFTRFQFNLYGECYGRPPYGLVVGPSLPLFPTASMAIRDFCGVRLGGTGEITSDFAVLLPDYRARISALRISSTKLAVECEWNRVELSSFVGKVFARIQDKTLSKEFEGGTHKFEFDLPSLPSYVASAIVASDGLVVDSLSYSSDASYDQPDIEVELSADDLEQFVLSGESERLEFKREIPKERQAVAVWVTAMANRQGGRILLGVDDEGKIVGYPASKPEETIRNVLRDWCNPPLEPQIKVVPHEERQVVVIDVSEGSNKPYCVRDRGIYVRSGSTNRLATRHEVDQMYEARSSLFRAFQ